MNKKYLILGIVLLLVVGITNAARANSFSDVLNTLSNQLYWLRDNLKAQVSTDFQKKFSDCTKDSDCYVPYPCGSCLPHAGELLLSQGFCEKWMEAKNSVINKKYTYNELYPWGVNCPAIACATWNPYKLIPTRCNNGFCEVDKTKNLDSKKYVILKNSEECALRDLCKTNIDEVNITRFTFSYYNTLEDCNLAKAGKLTVQELRSQRDNLLKQLETATGKKLTPTLPIGNTPEELQSQIKHLLTLISDYISKATTTTTTRPTTTTTTRPTTTTTNRLKYLCDSVKKTCTLVDSVRYEWSKLYNTSEECRTACSGTTTTTSTKPVTPINRPTVTREMRVCSADKDCGFGIDNQVIPCTGSWSKGYGSSKSQVAINSNSVLNYNNQWKTYLKSFRPALTVMCDDSKNSLTPKCVNNICELVDNSQPNIDPLQATDQWYKLTEYQGCKMDEWSKTCFDTSAAKNSGNEYKYCMNQYLLSKKITFTDVTIKNMPTPGEDRCMACGCEMPEIFLKAKTNFENELNKIGFTKSNDPEAKDELYVEGNKLSVDLSYQGLFYKEDRDTGKINYAIISKNDKATCGDNICHPRENYLYQIDLSKHCSVLSDKIINFDHCPQDCKDTFDITKAITKDEFNKLEFGCKNQSQIEPTVITPKSPEQMTPTEKNNLIIQLQQQLLVLLMQLREMMLAQRQ